MALTVQNVLDNFLLTYKGVPDTISLALLNEVDMLLCRHFPIRKTHYRLPLVQGVAEYALDSKIIYIEAARYVPAPITANSGIGGYALEETNVDFLDTSGLDWRAAPCGPPSKFFINANFTSGQFALDAPSVASTLLVTAASNVSPIRIATNRAHGLADGYPVDIMDVAGNLAANGHWFIKVFDATHFDLYADSSLTVASSGSGAYTDSGIVSAAGSPFVQLYARWHQPLGIGDSLPDAPIFLRLYSNGMKFLYAQDRDLPNVEIYNKLFTDAQAEQFMITQQRGGRKNIQMRIEQQTRTPSVSRTSW
jgi:hypothetical protein